MLLGVFALFGVGGCLLIAGIVAQNSSLLYGSGGISGVGLIVSVYLCARDRRGPSTFETPVFPPRVYKDPGMKKNKSDTNLELMGAPKNTQDDVGPTFIV